MLLLILSLQSADPFPTLEAAKSLAELRTPAAMVQRLELFEASWTAEQGVILRDALYAGMRRANSQEEGDQLVRGAANPQYGEALRILCLRALEESGASADAGLLFGPDFAGAPAAVSRAWQAAAGRCLAADRAVFTPSVDAIQSRLRLTEAGAPFLGHAFLRDWTDTETAAIAQAARRSKSAPDRAEALRVLAAHRADQAPFVAAAAVALKSVDRATRAAVLLGAAEHDAFEVVPLLVDFLEQSAPAAEGRWVQDAAESLGRLTGLPFGPKPEVWRRWWIAEGASWLEGRRRGAAAPPAADGVRRANESDSVSARLFGLPVDSTRVAILVDGSGSMSSSRVGKHGAVTAVAREFGFYCERLPEKSLFQIWMIEEQPAPLFKKAMPANPANRRQAERFLLERPYRNSAAMVEALEAAMLDPAIDTIILIGSGSRGAGLHADEEHVISAARRFYARHGVRIHTVLIPGHEEQAGFMRRLAEAAGGRTAQAGAGG